MSIFRSPLYLNIETLIPLANYHNIEVMADIQLTQRDLGKRSGKAGVSASMPVASFNVGGTKGSESEVTQARTIKDHPSNALNRLLDELHRTDAITTDVTTSPIQRHQLVEIIGDWEISAATDAGSLLTAMAHIFANNPGIANSGTMDPASAYRLINPAQVNGPVVLNAELNAAGPMHVVALLDGDLLVGSNSVDDLEGDRTVFAQVDTFEPEDSIYDLKKFFLSGLSRVIRRSINVEDLIASFTPVLGTELTTDDLRVKGPVIVVKPIAIY